MLLAVAVVKMDLSGVGDYKLPHRLISSADSARKELLQVAGGCRLCCAEAQRMIRRFVGAVGGVESRHPS
jgi:hypothetical protein